MVDVLPLQIASWQWKHDQAEWMYTTAATLEAWSARIDAVRETLRGEGFGTPYYYGPVFAAALSPLADLPAVAWRNALFCVNAALVPFFAACTLRVSGAQATPRNALWSLALTLLAFPVSRATMLGQVVPLIAAVFWIGVLCARDRRETLAGVAFGVATAIKLFPLGLVLVPAISRRWRQVALWLLVPVTVYALSVLALGLDVHRAWWDSLREFGARFYPFQGNQSLIGWYSRVFRRLDLDHFVSYTDPGLEAAHVVLASLVGGTTLLAVWRSRRWVTPETSPLFHGLVMSGVLLSLANAWEHYWLFCLPLVGLAIREVWHGGHAFQWAWIGIMAFLYLMKLTRFYADHLPGRIASGSQAAAMLMLWMWLLWRVRRAPSLTARGQPTSAA
jgi:hypothetical protein